MRDNSKGSENTICTVKLSQHFQLVGIPLNDRAIYCTTTKRTKSQITWL